MCVPDIQCLDGWTLEENMCYKFIPGIQQYAGAVSLCKQEGGSTVSFFYMLLYKIFYSLQFLGKCCIGS